MTNETPRAIGVVRVSKIGHRDEDRLASPDEQVKQMQRACARLGFELISIQHEIDVSGRSPLKKRPGLLYAIEEVEAGRAEVVIAAYFDRLVRSLVVQAEVLTRIERAGGRVLSGDLGQITHESSAQWLSATTVGMVAEYVARSIAERTKGAQEAAVLAGRAPFQIIPGLKRAQDGTLVIDDATAPVVRRAFEMRDEGSSVAVINAYLREHGIDRCATATVKMLQSRLAIGEVHYRGWKGSCAQLVDPALFARIQGRRVLRGRYAKTPGLLSRLGVLTCEACGARMSYDSGLSHEPAPYPTYRCTNSACPASPRASIAATVVEPMVVAEVKRLAASLRGRASNRIEARRLRGVAERDRLAFENAVDAFDGLGEKSKVREKLQLLSDAADTSRDAAAAAERRSTSLEISVEKNWDDLSFEGQRQLVRDLIDRVTITPGRIAPSSRKVHISSVALAE